MTNLEKAARQALVFIESLTGLHIEVKEEQDEIITAMREALAEEAEQEPVAWMNDITPMGVFARNKEGAKNFGCTIPLYAAPVRTKDLTDDELDEIYSKPQTHKYQYARAIIAADRRKNK